MIPENRFESVQGHLRAIERVLGWNLVFVRTDWWTYAGLMDHGGENNEMMSEKMSEEMSVETATTFAKEFSNAHARHLTTTISSVAPTN